ncbi:coenzyme F420-dependent glucose-6-phosphate dehydrogenase [Prauserella sediminis]|uniref:Coenzyme F420-dependent glucose-6-phosphate dehydrogenase n=1 Tax=Prauserella sediminis TaxID=577680 RepID=A0A839XWM0_9PSEU|nr:LLM class flavin-dependent oxidoreductase [Prauserella sediminis]MBB3664426.1 coenzyme F420-dependent glucose-6-phosphate dehydrogenase [Prauserella sediminis]
MARSRSGGRRRGRFEQRGDSLRVVVFAGTDPVTGRRTYLREKINGTDDAAWRKAENTLTQLRAKVLKQRSTASTVRFDYAVDEWLRTADIEQSTRDSYVGYIDRVIKPVLGDVAVNKLGARQLENLYADLRRCRMRCDGNPAVVAQAFGTLGALYPGRVVLGLGTGEALNEVPVTRIEWPEFRERFARLREAIELIRRLWTEERVTFDGDYYSTENATVYDRPARPVPIYVAAGGSVVAKYAGRAADGFICTSGKGMDLYTEKLQPAVDRGAEQVGRKPGDVPRSIEIKLSYDPDPATAAENTRFWAPLSLTAEQKHGLSDPVDIERAAEGLPIEQVASRWIVSVDPDEVTQRISSYVDAGFTDLVLHAAGSDQARFLEVAGQELLPRLRNLR